MEEARELFLARFMCVRLCALGRLVGHLAELFLTASFSSAVTCSFS